VSVSNERAAPGPSSAPRRRLVAWRGPDPQRIDAASLALFDDRLHATGSSIATGFAVSYQLTTVAGWITERLEVRVTVGDGQRDLVLVRDPAGAWSSIRTSTSAVDRHRSSSSLRTRIDHLELAGALDCDLGLCPLTNSMPILREDLIGAARRREQRHVELTMAWVSVPDLEVVASRQIYESGRATASGGAQIGFASDGFAEQIHVDSDGVVIDYPSIAQRIA
jgi:hypothetical protein